MDDIRFVIKDPTKGDWLGDSIQRQLKASDPTRTLLMCLLERVVVLENQLRDLLAAVTSFQEQPPTTAVPTPTAPTPGSPSDVAAESTTPMTPASLLSARPDTESGPVERDSGCAHPRLRMEASKMWAGPKVWGQCFDCGVWMWFAVTPAPAAGPTSSTSAKQDSNRFAETSAGVFAASPSSAFPSHVPEQHVRLPRRKA